MSRRTEQADRIEETLARVEAAVGRVMAEVRGARSAAEAASGAVHGLASVVGNPGHEAAHAGPGTGTEGRPAPRSRADKTTTREQP